jgi:hypothetical protein
MALRFWLCATENQRRELQRVAKRHGWNVVHMVADNGISGAKDRKDSARSRT